MTEYFGTLPSGEKATLYTITNGRISASVTDYGATLVRLMVPDTSGKPEDVVLGYDDCNGYRTANGACLGAIVGRNANRIKDSRFTLNGNKFQLTPNEGNNNLHSGPDFFHLRLWNAVEHTQNSVTFTLMSPNGDQGFPGDALIHVTYQLDNDSLHIIYNAITDQDTVFNMTNHSYFNLAGHENTGAAVNQVLTMPGRFFCPDHADNIPTGELRTVDGTPMDFRSPKPIGKDIDMEYEPLLLQGGYDHNWEVYCNPCAVLHDPVSGRTMEVHTDCPGIQLYAGNFLNESGKEGVHYGKRSGIALETQFYPDAVHHPDWPQPVTKAGHPYHSETIYRFVL